MNFISTSTQKADVLPLLPLAGVKEVSDHLALQVAEEQAQSKVGIADMGHNGDDVHVAPHELHAEVTYDFSPSAKELLDELLPLTVKTALFQCFLDATTSENVARMLAMKSATDNADKMVKSLTMRYNRARQSQITTELSEIMGGVEAMKA
jgi:F-type H+-transporting ATPase subunit gamma